MKRSTALGLVAALGLFAGVALWLQQDRTAPVRATGLELERILSWSGEGFATAEGEWVFRFPADHGAHLQFRSEVWYLAGNLEDGEGRRYGFQVAFFRVALAPDSRRRPSAWATNQLYRAHFGLTDVSEGRFRAVERFGRAALGLAGSDEGPERVWLEDWSLEVTGARGVGDGFVLRVGDESSGLEIELSPAKPPVLQGEAELLARNPTGPGSFHFYLLPRLSAVGVLQAGEGERRLSGSAWLDRAWGAVPLSRGQIALNRFALQLEDGRDLLCLQLRRRDGSGTPVPSCLLVGKDGSVKSFRRREILLEPLGVWLSPLDGASYPLRWRIGLPGEGMDLEIEPLVENQELDFALRSWSGAVRVSGRSGDLETAGYGHVELGGYAEGRSGI